MDTLSRRHWIFDLDGTLTVAMHDFDAFKGAHGLPPDVPILEALDAMGGPRAASLHVRLADWERDVAAQSMAQPGARELLETLAARGARMGILTRNTRAIALATLEAARLDGFFTEALVIGRDEAPPKPDPAGAVALMRRWGAAAGDAVLVGDFLFDLQAGRRAGAHVIYLDPSGDFPHRAEADRCVTSLIELLES
ncbi:HAD family hydrolase [Engelhardtia mirabilis]|uniref:Pyrophosphatase PpaX n=1 Tax=Engelhardtia mirabilis TaxID=2528011 RepID=A0A518BFX1_9BACT|nr:Pyrophosphatase PpaX [Planctomycetes bacterium Pla133]QDV00201.1 Pyrophosphatase PpaX [Planctomycetes bacterium Pla86]